MQDQLPYSKNMKKWSMMFSNITVAKKKNPLKYKVLKTNNQTLGQKPAFYL
jgi:hypothetical protein